MIKDNYNRVHNYLRISLTDSCNLRCSYCMPEENISCMPSHQLMQPEEIESIAKVFSDLGVKKIRLTGGEPLVRKEFKEIAERLSKLPVEMSITTNAVLADRFVDTFRKTGINTLNVSLDTLQEDKFFLLTKRTNFQKVKANIQMLLEEGFFIKLNIVAMKGINDDEVADFIELTRNYQMEVRFIEFMPFSGNKWENQKVITAKEMLEIAQTHFEFIKLKDPKHSTAKKYKVLGYKGTFAFITTMSTPFCSDCNRMRITADGKMKNCLFSKGEMDLLSTFRQGGNIVPLIKQNLLMKHPEMGGQFKKNYEETDGNSIDNRSMIKIGG